MNRRPKRALSIIMTAVSVSAAIESGVTVVEYTPAEIKRAVVGYGRAEKPQVGQMVKLLLGLDAIPKPGNQRGDQHALGIALRQRVRKLRHAHQIDHRLPTVTQPRQAIERDVVSAFHDEVERSKQPGYVPPSLDGEDLDFVEFPTGNGRMRLRPTGTTAAR